jgi:predicted secreted protein
MIENDSQLTMEDLDTIFNGASEHYYALFKDAFDSMKNGNPEQQRWYGEFMKEINAPRDYSDPSESIIAFQGNDFTIALDSNPTTGYLWNLLDNFNKDVVDMVGLEFKTPENGEVGSGGKEVWTFKAVGSGETRIELEYLMPMEKNKPPDKTVSFKVTILDTEDTNSLNTHEQITETKVIHYVPPTSFDDDIKVRTGFCWTTSVKAPRKDAWRCMVGNRIFDPCFSIEGGEYVFHQPNPATDTGGFLVKLTEPLPEPEGISKEKNFLRIQK